MEIDICKEDKGPLHYWIELENAVVGWEGLEQQEFSYLELKRDYSSYSNQELIPVDRCSSVVTAVVCFDGCCRVSLADGRSEEEGMSPEDIIGKNQPFCVSSLANSLIFSLCVSIN